MLQNMQSESWHQLVGSCAYKCNLSAEKHSSLERFNFSLSSSIYSDHEKERSNFLFNSLAEIDHDPEDSSLKIETETVTQLQIFTYLQQTTGLQCTSGLVQKSKKPIICWVVIKICLPGLITRTIIYIHDPSDTRKLQSHFSLCMCLNHLITWSKKLAQTQALMCTNIYKILHVTNSCVQ